MTHPFLLKNLARQARTAERSPVRACRRGDLPVIEERAARPDQGDHNGTYTRANRGQMEWPVTPELVTAISWSFVIAVLACAVSVYQSAITNRHNRQTVSPVLQLRSTFRLGQTAGLHLANVG